jgi:hypothetical protein
MIGFTFAYGSMFAKVWIVHRMGANENHELASITKDEVSLDASLTAFYALKNSRLKEYTNAFCQSLCIFSH